MSRYIVLPDLDLNQDGRVTLSELLASTAIIILLLALILNITVQAIGAWLATDWRVLPALAITTAVAIIAGCLLGIWRMLRYEIAFRFYIDDRQRAQALEDEERALRNGLNQREQQTRFTQADVDAGAWKLMRTYYNGGSIARASPHHNLSEDLWNRVNDLLKKRGIRRGRRNTLEPETLDQAWALWCQAKLQARGHYIVTDDGDLLEDK